MRASLGSDSPARFGARSRGSSAIGCASCRPLCASRCVAICSALPRCRASIAVLERYTGGPFSPHAQRMCGGSWPHCAALRRDARQRRPTVARRWCGRPLAHASAKFPVGNPTFCFLSRRAGRSPSRPWRSGLVVKGQVRDRSLQCQNLVAGACDHMPLRVNGSLLKTVMGAMGCLRDCSARSTEIKTLQRSPGNCLHLPC